jgi:ABC-2 type transport system ATP-binding protein
MSQLVLDRISRTFRGSPPVDALRDVSFTVDAGEILGLLGPNGAGKTTLIKILATLLLPTSGRASVCGHDVARHPMRARRQLSVVLGGDRGLYEKLTVLDNLMFFAALHGLRAGLRTRALEALERVGLADRSSSPVETCSKGMRQRLHLAAGLMVDSAVLLLDEPTIGLDIAEAQRVRDLVRSIAATGTAVVLTSHYPADIDALASRIVLLQSGTVSHDLPAAAFRRLVGHVAEVVIRGRGPVPLAASGAGCTVERADGTWRISFRVTEWQSAELSRLVSVSAGGDVVDVQVLPVGIETALTALTREPAGTSTGSLGGTS